MHNKRMQRRRVHSSILKAAATPHCNSLQAFRTASLRHDIDGQATLLNLLLRNYLAHNLYDQADKLISKTNLSEQVLIWTGRFALTYYLFDCHIYGDDGEVER